MLCPLTSPIKGKDETEEQREALAEVLANLNGLENNFITTGKESKFIYPPMITLRLGDLFYDQPCVISSVGVNVPDDTNWESLRSDDYSYRSSPTNRIEISGTNLLAGTITDGVDRYTGELYC